jgi:ankyrin repeat protein
MTLMAGLLTLSLACRSLASEAGPWDRLRQEIKRQVTDADHPTTPTGIMFYMAAEAGDAEMVGWLKAHHGQVDTINPALMATAMQTSILDGQTTATKILLEAGARPNSRDLRGGSPALLDAVNLDNDQAVALLLKHGADPGIRELQDGITPLISAANGGNRRIVRLLLAGGADPNQADPEGRAPLHLAVLLKHPDVVVDLIEHGADPNRATKAGITPLALARRQHMDAMVALLKAHGARDAAPAKR